MSKRATLILGLLAASAATMTAPRAHAQALPLVTIPAQVPANNPYQGIKLVSWQRVDADGAGGNPPSERLYDAVIISDAIFTPNKPIQIGVRILLPDDYQTAPSSTRYPVLTLLHGGNGQFSDFSKNADDGGRVQELVDALTKPALLPPGATPIAKMIVVMPEGGRTSWYSDWYGQTDGGFKPKWETFHTLQLVKWLDFNLRTKTGAANRAIAGLSMGGLGALKYAANHPDVYSAVGSLSGAADLLFEPAQDLISNTMWAFGATVGDTGLFDSGYRVTYPGSWPEDEETKRLVNLFGPQTGGDWPNANPSAMIGKLGDSRLVKRALYSGRKLTSSDSGEQEIQIMNDTLHGRLKAAGVSHRYCGGFGTHAWNYWRADLTDFLQYVYGTRPVNGTPCTTNPGWTVRN